MLEQSVDVLRAAPPPTWNIYVSGAAPFLVAVVYGVARVSIHKISAEEMGLNAVILTCLFLWMQWRKVRFAQNLAAQLASAKQERANYSAAVFLQGTKLMVVPLSLLAVFPLAWAVAFYRNVTALAKRPNLIRESARFAGLWQGQNWSALGLIALFACVVFLNVAILLGILPFLARMLSGYDNEFTRDPVAMLNATFAAAACGLTWLLVDPLIQAMYVVRCFKGESVGSGADLRAALRRLVIVFALACTCLTVLPARTITPVELDGQIRHTLEAPQYSWQNPENSTSDSPQWAQKVIQVAQAIQNAMRTAIDWLGAKLRDWLRSQGQHVERGSAAPQSTVRWAVYIALGLVALVTILFLRKAFAARLRKATPIVPVSAADVAEDAIASELPEEEWLRLAGEALERGDLRIALRAAYLANLAWLGSAGLLVISRFKSNRDYEREVRLRSRSEEITRLLRYNREVFESAWYGDEAKAHSDVDDVRRNLARMRELVHA